MGIADGRRRFPNRAFLRRQPGLDSLNEELPEGNPIEGGAALGQREQFVGKLDCRPHMP
jgi:hypothetical protein